MNNHYHLVITTPLSNVDKFMEFFNQQLGRKIARDAGRINRAGLVERCRDYPYYDLKERYLEATKSCGDINFDAKMLEWLERPLSAFDTQQTKKNLRQWVIENEKSDDEN